MVPYTDTMDTACCSLEVHKSIENIAGLPTLVLQVGKESRSNYCAVVITGNPGLIELYEVFMLQIHKTSNCQLQVIGVSHAGHSPVWKYSSKDSNNNNYRKANHKTLEEQVEHKLAFIEKFVPKDKKLILIGHSIGAYIVLKLLEYQEVEKKVHKCLLLFPTVENIADTPNGSFWTPASFYFRHPIALIGLFFSYMPNWVQRILVEWRTTWKGRTSHPLLSNVLRNCINYTVLNNAMVLAASEMKDVIELSDKTTETVQRNLSKITFYYGADDKWAPPHFCSSMRDRFPEGDIRLCQNGFAHDFVIDSSEEVAELVWDMVSHLMETD